MPDPLNWAFSVDNDAVFDREGNTIYLASTAPEEWVKRGEADIRAALRANSEEADNQTQQAPGIPPPAISSVPPSAAIAGALGALAGAQMSYAADVSIHEACASAAPMSSAN